MKTYYGLLKSGALRQYEKPPKRDHVVMDSICTRDGTSTHVLRAGTAKRQFVAHCGYDRGPRLDRLVTKMLGENSF